MIGGRGSECPSGAPLATVATILLQSLQCHVLSKFLLGKQVSPLWQTLPR